MIYRAIQAESLEDRDCRRSSEAARSQRTQRQLSERVVARARHLSFSGRDTQLASQKQRDASLTHSRAST